MKNVIKNLGQYIDDLSFGELLTMFQMGNVSLMVNRVPSQKERRSKSEHERLQLESQQKRDRKAEKRYRDSLRCKLNNYA